MSFWRNTSTALFYIKPGGPDFIKCISVDKVDLLNSEVVLSGMLPLAAGLNGIQNGALLEVLNQYGDPSIYDAGRVILRFSHCRVMDKVILNVVALGPEQADIIRLQVTLAADIQILAEE